MLKHHWINVIREEFQAFRCLSSFLSASGLFLCVAKAATTLRNRTIHPAESYWTQAYIQEVEHPHLS